MENNNIHDEKNILQDETEIVQAVTKPGISIGKSIKFFFSILLCQFLVSFVIGIVIAIMSGLGLGSIIPSSSYILMINIVLSYLLVYKFINKNNQYNIKFTNKLNYKECLIGVLIMAGFYLMSQNSIIVLLLQITPSKIAVKAFTDLFQSTVVALAMTLVIAPVFEELFFRAIILGQLTKRYNPIVSLLISSLLFGIIHLNIIQGVNAFFLGIVLGFIYQKTSNLSLCMLLHATYNLFALLSLILYIRSSVLLMIGVILLCTSLVIFSKLNHSKPEQEIIQIIE